MKFFGVIFLLAFASLVLAETPVSFDHEEEQQHAVAEDVNRIGPHYVPSPYAHAYGYPDGFAVQTGYEGYLIPAPPKTSFLGKHGLMSYLPSFLTMYKYAGKFGGLISNIIWHFFIGSAVTLGVCTLTPFCTLTFLGFGLRKNKVREQLRTFVTPTMIDEVSRFVRLAIEKYEELQQTSDKEEEEKQKEEIEKIDDSSNVE